jgi:predicted  nucleic acid-binding Zn-ribbon protein
MAVTREEVSIRLGVDSRAAISGLEKMQMQVRKFANAAQNKLGSIFKANVFMAAAQAVDSMKPHFDKLMHMMLGIGDETVRILNEQSAATEEFAKKQEATINALVDSKERLRKAGRDEDFENANNLDRLAILDGEMTANDAIIKQLRERIALLKATKQPSAAEQTKLNDAIVQEIALKKQVGATTKGLSDEERAEYNRRKTRQRQSQNIGFRREYSNITEEMQALAEDGDFGPDYQRLDAQRKAARGSLQENVFRARSDVTSMLPKWDVFKPFQDFYDPKSNYAVQSSQAMKGQQEAMTNALNAAMVKVVISQIKL